MSEIRPETVETGPAAEQSRPARPHAKPPRPAVASLPELPAQDQVRILAAIADAVPEVV